MPSGSKSRVWGVNVFKGSFSFYIGITVFYDENANISGKIQYPQYDYPDLRQQTIHLALISNSSKPRRGIDDYSIMAQPPPAYQPRRGVDD